ncbi:MAG TPA: phospholipase D-like domain-containing protein [Saprospiraceae bacterium]|nr:phospholipase D-like domain-containing protein [Saprospiraceae bacterium]
MAKALTVFLLICTPLVIDCQQSITQVRALPVGSVVTTTGTISCSNEFGVVRYLQDADAGIAAYSTDLTLAQSGDSVVITGVLSRYRGQLQLSPVLSYQILSQGHEINSLNLENLDSISNAGFESRKVIIPCAGIKSCESELSAGWYEVFDPWGNIARLWIAENHLSQGFPLFNRPVVVEGIWTKFEDQYQLMCQQITEAPEGVCHFIAPPTLSFENSLPVLSWSDIPTATTDVWIGENDYDFKISLGQWSGTAVVKPEFLDPGIIYQARLTQQDSSGTLFHSVPVYFSTPSLTSTPIEILFNRSVNASFSDGSVPLAVGSSAIENDLIERIDKVTHTLEVAMYNTGRASIVQALTRAIQRGVSVRFIADDETSNTALQGQLSFPLLFRSGDGIMHNKFIIADDHDPERAWVWTGSTNLSTNQLSTDPNHAYIIHDQAIALNYLREFNEMWGQDARYGDFKTNNTSHLFQVGDARIESYFSPSDETNCHLIEAIQSTDHQILIGLLLLTRDDLVGEIIKLHQQGIDVRVILEDEESSLSALAQLRQAGVRVVTHDPGPIFHHKYAIIDEGFTDSDPQVITGSHNWTWSADNINDENTLIIHDQRVTNIFRQEFEARWGELNTTSVQANSIHHVRVYPNPASSFLHVENPFTEPGMVELINVNGQIVFREEIEAARTSVLTFDQPLPDGLYMVRVVSATRLSAVFTLVVQQSGKN